MTRRALLLAVPLCVLLVLPTLGRQAATSPFAAAIAQLSEPAGYFDTDNLISNESSYLQVLPDLSQRVHGGAYVGVGPDQNFSYIAAVRPSVAYIVDIRRDNVLLHLLFKSLFHESRSRVEYLALLFGRTAPRQEGSWRTASAEALAAYIEKAPRTNAPTLHAQIERVIKGLGVPLSVQDLATIAGFHQRFIDAGLTLRFQSAGRPPQWNYPTYGDMLVDRDASGRPANYLSSEEGFQFVRELQRRDLVIPVVGDLAGPSAVVKVGKAIAARGEKLSAFYVSNVEFYLFGEGTFPRFVANLGQVPHAGEAVLIRSFFSRGGVPRSRASDNSASQLQRVDDLLREFAAGRVRSYSDLAGR
jgi:hypothetical protein